MMNLRRSIDGYFFAPWPAERLGITRCLFYAWYAVQLWVYDPVQYARLPQEYWQPTLMLRAFEAPTVLQFQVAVWTLAVAVLLACIGLFTRAATATTAVLGLYVFGVVGGYGTVNFHFAPMMFIAVIFAFADTGSRFSIDRSLRGGEGSGLGARYSWPLRLSQLVLIALMTTGGLRKLAGTWLQHPLYNMDYWLSYKATLQARQKGISLPDFVLSFTDSPTLLVAFTVALLAAECLAPLALITAWPRIRGFIVWMMFAMQLVLAVVLNTLPSFPWLGAYLCFVPWDRVFQPSGLPAHLTLERGARVTA